MLTHKGGREATSSAARGQPCWADGDVGRSGQEEEGGGGDEWG